jgi:Zn-dependent oligopeptidase
VPPYGGRKHPEQQFIQVDTKNILFICGGAFDGIERRIAQRLNTHVVGFDAVQNVTKIDKSNLMQYIAPMDLKSFGLIPEIISRYKSPYFQHIFTTGYDAGYYSYTWTAILDHDAFAAFVESGDLYNPELAKKFRHILESGNTEDPMQMYINFRGKEPSVTPLLKDRGLI